MKNWKVNDWCIYDLNIVQVLRVDDEIAEVTDGNFNTSGRIIQYLRPLTIRNKRTIEYFDYYYSELRNIKGERGFNWPDISRYFCQLSRNAIDNVNEADRVYHDLAMKFVDQAKSYTPNIQGVELFRN